MDTRRYPDTGESGDSYDAEFLEDLVTVATAPACPRCGSDDLYHNGRRRNRIVSDASLYYCKACHRQFGIRDHESDEQGHLSNLKRTLNAIGIFVMKISDKAYLLTIDSGFQSHADDLRVTET